MASHTSAPAPRGNLMVANLEEVLTADIVSERDFVNTEHLVTLVVIVPKYAQLP